MDLEKKILYHYTTISGLIGILEKKYLRATYFRSKNDLTELSYAKEVMLNSLTVKDSQIAKRLEHLCESLFKEGLIFPFLFSFCDDHGDRLSQWRGYSDVNGGYSIGFDFDVLTKCYNEENKNYKYPHIELSYVSYCQDIISADLKNSFDKLLVALKKDDKSFEYLSNNILGPFLECYLKIKHKGFEEEKEFRLTALLYKNNDPSIREIKFYDGLHGTPIPYIEMFNDVHLAIKEIIIGPANDSIHREKIIKMLLDKEGLKIPIKQSKIPFRA